MKEIVCIVCPNGCRLTIDETTHIVEGNKCVRGKDYALNELTCPKRSVTTTIKTTSKSHPTLSVRTDGEINKEDIFKLIIILKDVVIDKPVDVGDVVLKNVCNSGIDVIATSKILKEDF